MMQTLTDKLAPVLSLWATLLIVKRWQAMRQDRVVLDTRNLIDQRLIARLRLG